MREADLWALFALHGGAKGVWAPVMVAASFVGGGWGTLALVPLFWRIATRRFAAVLAVAVAVQATLVWATKLAVGRVRPWIAFGWPAPLDAPHDGSFPSGHAAGSFCVAAFLAVVLPALWPSRQRAFALAAAVAAFAALVALSRVYLGAHFPSDVFAGALLGAVVGVAGGRTYLRLTSLPVSRRATVPGQNGGSS